MTKKIFIELNSTIAKNIFKLLFLIILSTYLLLINKSYAENQQRIITLGGGSSEIVSALGKQDNIVAIDLTVSYPKELRKLPSIGYIGQINAENILSMKPDIIISDNRISPQNQVEYLKASPAEIIILNPANTIDDVYNRIKTVAKKLGATDKANLLVKEMKARHAILQQKFTKIDKKVRVMGTMISGNNITSSGGNSGLGKIISLAQGENIFEKQNNYKVMNNEAIIMANPDVIVVLSHNIARVGKDFLFNHPAISKTNAGKNNRIYVIDTSLMLSFGPRSIDAIKELSKIFYPNIM